jgi:hypothetical protein
MIHARTRGHSVAAHRAVGKSSAGRPGKLIDSVYHGPIAASVTLLLARPSADSFVACSANITRHEGPGGLSQLSRMAHQRALA